jgi:CubicO group peptidase (beta-lactamase class C family)
MLAASAGTSDAKTDIQDLNPLLEPVRKDHDLPALAALVIWNGRVVGRGAVGVRKAGASTPVTIADKFHIGSCTKAMTATVAGILVEQGKLRWQLPLAEAFPELARSMHPAYRSVTLEQLLAHRGGLPSRDHNWPKGSGESAMFELPGTIVEQRAAYARMVLGQPPEVSPGSRYLYSNAGYIVAGSLMERATGNSWEELMTRLVFRPLGMTSAAFGAPGAAGKLDQPWQHRVALGLRVPVGPGPRSDNPPVLGPAGRVHCSLDDWANFALQHLEGARGQRGLVSAETFQKLHSPVGKSDYALGWLINTPDWADGPGLCHDGSNDRSYAFIQLAPAKRFAVLVATNQGGTKARTACESAATELARHVLQRTR